MFFRARHAGEPVDSLTVIEVAPLMENVDPNAVIFNNTRFVANPKWFPHVDESTVEEINKHFSFLVEVLNIRDWFRRPAFSRGLLTGDDPTIKRAYIPSLLKEHHYHDKRFNPIEPNAPQINEETQTPVGSNSLIQWSGDDSDFACVITLLFKKGYIRANDLTEAMRIAGEHFSGISKNVWN